MRHNLAILIPAYKKNFLTAALDSLCAQSCKDFKVYVADDASPEDLESVVMPFKERLDLDYRRFEENLGSKDLVSAWERNADMAEEEWIWLFSDDDIMAPDAVERFYAARAEHPQSLIFRLPLAIIDGEGAITRPAPAFPSGISSAEEILMDYFNGKRQQAACEYVFHRSLYDAMHMVHFPLAWCSDAATWYLYASKAGSVVNLEGLPMQWRNVEGSNISSTAELQSTKMRALSSFLLWLDENYKGFKGHAFRGALRHYIGMNLKYAFGLKLPREGFRELCRTYFKLCPVRATALYSHYKKHVTE